MNQIPKRSLILFHGMLLVALGILPANADLGLDDEPFFSEDMRESVGEVRLSPRSKWVFSLGGGYSFISPYAVDIPNYLGFIYLSNGITVPARGVTTFRKTLNPAGVFEASLERKIRPWVSVGLMGGVSEIL